jgi:hypothetical protein
MDKSNKFIWANSFAVDEDVPKCPQDISEPAWAQLLYSPYCQVCHPTIYPIRPYTGVGSQVCVSGVALSFFTGHGYLLGFVPSIVQKMPSRSVGPPHGAEYVNSFSRVISQSHISDQSHGRCRRNRVEIRFQRSRIHFIQQGTLWTQVEG